MKKTLHTAGFAMLMLLGFTACKKDSNSASNTKALITGKWKSTFEANDANGNGSLDESEKTAVSASDAEYVTFNANGTLVDSVDFGGGYQTVPGSWLVTSDNKYLNLTILGFNESGKLTQIDASNLIVQDTSTTPASWTGYVHY